MRYLWLWPIDYFYAGWLQVRALFSRRVPDHFADGALNPVLLVAGVWEPWFFLRDLGGLLNRAGHPVHVVTAIGYSRASIAEVAAVAQTYLDTNDVRAVTVLAHSKGGLVGKQLLAASDRVDRLIAIATPFSGSTYANFMPTRALREFRPEDAALLALAAMRDLNGRVTSIYPSFDPHIPGGSYLEGAHNVVVPTGGHFRILRDHRVVDAVLEAVARKNDAGPGVD